MHLRRPFGIPAIFEDTCGRDSVVNHAVVLIGYGHSTEHNKAGMTAHGCFILWRGISVELLLNLLLLPGQDYWYIRNSWGDAWGEGGFIRLLRHSSYQGEAGYCGVDRNPKAMAGRSISTVRY